MDYDISRVQEEHGGDRSVSRLTLPEAIKRYEEGKLPSSMVTNFSFEEYGDDVDYIIPAMVGAMLQLDLKSISAPQLGSGLPIMVLRLPVIRILIDPLIITIPDAIKKQTRVNVSAYNYKRESVTLDSMNEYVDKWDNESLAHSVHSHLALWNSIELGVA